MPNSTGILGLAAEAPGPPLRAGEGAGGIASTPHHYSPERKVMGVEVTTAEDRSQIALGAARELGYQGTMTSW